jgi:hypothetical protein
MKQAQLSGRQFRRLALQPLPRSERLKTTRDVPEKKATRFVRVRWGILKEREMSEAYQISDPISALMPRQLLQSLFQPGQLR